MAKTKGNINRWLWHNIRRNFLAGLLVGVPLAVVILVLIWIFNAVDGILQPIIELVFGRRIPGLGFVITLALIYIAGLITSNIIGRQLVQFGESIMQRIPILRQIYSGSKQVITGLSGTSLNKAAFRDVVLIEFPRPGMTTLGFITKEIRGKDGEKLLSVYIPTAPVPSSGYFEIVPENMVKRTNITVDQAMQMVLSSGMVSPDVIDIQGPILDTGGGSSLASSKDESKNKHGKPDT
jgi:uncharacterized membrane protein